MAPSPIAGRYKLYKKGTNKLVAWLAKTASRCCDITDILTSITPATPAATIKIRTRDLIALAKAIASARPPIELSASVLKACEDVIAGREACAEWYAAQAIQDASDLAEQNRTHKFFIDTLKKVHELLSTCKQQASASTPAKTTKTTKSSKSKKKAAASLENMFAHLEVEEPSASPLGEARKRTEHSIKAQESLAQAEIELEQEGDDHALAIWCLLQDLNDVRNFICATWKEYCDGELSLIAAATVTDTAFGLIRRINEDFETIYPSLRNWWDLENFLDIRMALVGNMVWMVPAKSGGSPKNASPDLNPAEMLCPSAAYLLRYFRNNVRAIMDGIGTIRKSFVDDPHMFMLPPVPGFEQVLLQTLIEIGYYANAREECAGKRGVLRGAEDEFANGLVEYCIGDNLPIWLVVATQTLMEVFDLIHANPKCGADEFVATVAHHGAVLTQSRTFYDRFKEGFLQPTWDAEIEMVNKTYEKIAEGLLESDNEDLIDPEPCGPVAKGVAGELLKRRKELFYRTVTPMQWMLRFPLMPGVLVHSMKTVMYKNGTLMANDGAVVLAAAHLYKAARHYGLISEWHDMDWLLAQHGSKQPLVIKASVNADSDALLRHYLIAMGVPASTFARKPRPGLPPRGKITTGSRPINVTSDFHDFMCAQQDAEDKQGQTRGETMDVVIQQLADKAVASDSSPKRKGTTDVAMTPVQLLSIYKAEIIADEPKLNFDYIGFLELCAKILLGDVKNAVIDYLPDPSVRPCSIRCGYELVHFLLLDAAETVTRGHAIDSSLIAPAAIAMQAIIRAEGKKFTREAYNKSSGRIPKHLRPHFAQREQGFMHAQQRAIFEARGMKLGTRVNAPLYDPLATMDDLPKLLAGNARYDAWEETGYDAKQAPRDVVESMMDHFHGTHQERWDKAVHWLRCSHYEAAKLKGKGWVKGFPSIT
ncbi:hypothetical protein LTR56_013584 [Elasticomyces elasticus]|nr:hypothetical protein LTR56_013584 [Elasticomyces elasticus]KAK3651048.1 hypothetical protein LTR22_012296 [Elasticomyces elasticus]KAK4931126.1 hypothetical protein LTR49_002542 [Elasticomyces elasticus]KAK5765594.1 hypothetical protein LTS12_004346 [Elasticomyces elasticus]